MAKKKQPVEKPHNIAAHRDHVPLEVPPLRELPAITGERCVVRYSGKVYRADKFCFRTVGGCSVRYAVHMPATHFAPDYVSCDCVTELTKEQCIAEGYRWPLEDCK